MIERAIENWLINTNEKNYQVPFCQVLISQGHEILDISTHGRLEFGKDIISKDKKGVIHGYQLKTGNIDVPAWDKIYREVKIMPGTGRTIGNDNGLEIKAGYILIGSGPANDGVRGNEFEAILIL